MDYLRRSMREYTGAFCIALSMAILIASPLMVTNSEDTELSEESKRHEQFGGGGSLEEQCGSITFENMFEYSAANFDVIIDEDWDSAEVRAVAWVNNTLADDLRVVMDEFM